MPTLHIALEEGFAGDRVRLEVGGRVVYERDGVRTRTQVGFADSVDTDVPAGVSDVGVTVPTRGVSARFAVTVPQRLYVSVSLGPGGIVHRESDVPPAYA